MTLLINKSEQTLSMKSNGMLLNREKKCYFWKSWNIWNMISYIPSNVVNNKSFKLMINLFILTELINSKKKSMFAK